MPAYVKTRESCSKNTAKMLNCSGVKTQLIAVKVRIDGHVRVQLDTDGRVIGCDEADAANLYLLTTYLTVFLFVQISSLVKFEQKSFSITIHC